jgi:hypothetical protein
MRPAKPEGHLARIACLAFSPDGRQIVSGSEDSTLLVWDVESGQIVQRLEGHPRLFGDSAVEDVPLALPRDPNAGKPVLVPVGALQGSAQIDVEVSMERRAIAADADALEVRVVFGEDAEWLRIGLVSLADPTAPEMQAFVPGPGGAPWRKKARTRQPLPLREGIKPGCYRLEVEPCGPGKVCGGSDPATLLLQLPSGEKCKG